MNKADVGITNLELTEEEQEELDAQPESYTQQMANAYRQASTVLLTEVKKLNNKAEAAQAAEDAAAAEESGSGTAGDDFGG